MSAAVLVPAHERSDVAFVVSTLSLPQQDGNESRRLALQQAAIVPWLGELLVRWAPELVVVEEPFAGTIGKARQLLVPKESYHVIGILLAVLGTYGARVERMGPTSWKSKALGKGHGMTRKPGPKCPRGGSHTWAYDHLCDGPAVECLKCGDAYAVLTWARAAGYSGRLWDEADAIGIATAGGVLLQP